jgi:hypothetical protein
LTPADEEAAGMRRELDERWVRNLDATEMLGYPGQAPMGFRTGIRLAFGGFGAPVSVTAPPASQTQISNTGEVLSK